MGFSRPKCLFVIDFVTAVFFEALQNLYKSFVLCQWYLIVPYSLVVISYEILYWQLLTTWSIAGKEDVRQCNFTIFSCTEDRFFAETAYAKIVCRHMHKNQSYISNQERSFNHW